MGDICQMATFLSIAFCQMAIRDRGIDAEMFQRHARNASNTEKRMRGMIAIMTLLVSAQVFGEENYVPFRGDAPGQFAALWVDEHLCHFTINRNRLQQLLAGAGVTPEYLASEKFQQEEERQRLLDVADYITNLETECAADLVKEGPMGEDSRLRGLIYNPKTSALSDRRSTTSDDNPGPNDARDGTAAAKLAVDVAIFSGACRLPVDFRVLNPILRTYGLDARLLTNTQAPRAEIKSEAEYRRQQSVMQQRILSFDTADASQQRYARCVRQLQLYGSQGSAFPGIYMR